MSSGVRSTPRSPPRASYLPEYEHILTSPIDTRVTRILKTAGDAVSPGDSIVVLDLGESQLAVGRLDDQIAIKANQRDAEALDLASKLAALRVQVDMKSLELQSADYAVTKSRKLFDKGLTSGDAVRQAETDAERERIELAELETAKHHAEEAFTAPPRGAPARATGARQGA